MRLSCIADPSRELVADASIIINLNASGRAEAILRALPNRLLVVDTVVGELRHDSRNKRNDGALISSLADESLISIVSLDSLEDSHFERLVAGSSAETLDDGEAATLAYAVEKNALALIDERKATALSGRLFPNLTIGCTVDIFAHDSVQKTLGRGGLADAVFASLQQARMRVLPRHESWVVDLIGMDRARNCPSLPSRLRLNTREPAEQR